MVTLQLQGGSPDDQDFADEVRDEIGQCPRHGNFPNVTVLSTFPDPRVKVETCCPEFEATIRSRYVEHDVARAPDE